MEETWPSDLRAYLKCGAKIGRVWKARTTTLPNNIEREVLLRCIPFESPSTPATLDRIQDSVTRLRSVGNHPHILHCYHTFWDQHPPALNVVQEPTGYETYNIETLLSHVDCFEEKLILAILKQVLEVLHHLHSSHVVWYDCRASHIYLKCNGSIAVNTLSLRSILQLKTRDSLAFTSPEIILGQKEVASHEYKCKADIWSFGVMAIHMANGETPYKGLSITQIYEAIARAQPPSFNERVMANFSNSFKEMVELCLQEDPEKRPTAEQLLRHDAFVNAPDLPKRLIHV